GGTGAVKWWIRMVGWEEGETDGHTMARNCLSNPPGHRVGDVLEMGRITAYYRAQTDERVELAAGRHAFGDKRNFEGARNPNHCDIFFFSAMAFHSVQSAGQ